MSAWLYSNTVFLAGCANHAKLHHASCMRLTATPALLAQIAFHTSSIGKTACMHFRTWCRCRVQLHCSLGSLGVCAWDFGCWHCCRVPLLYASNAWPYALGSSGAGAAVCTLELVCWCRCRMPLPDVAMCALELGRWYR